MRRLPFLREKKFGTANRSLPREKTPREHFSPFPPSEKRGNRTAKKVLSIESAFDFRCIKQIFMRLPLRRQTPQGALFRPRSKRRSRRRSRRQAKICFLRARFVGEAYEDALDLEEKDRIIIQSGIVDNVYNKEKEKL